VATASSICHSSCSGSPTTIALQTLIERSDTEVADIRARWSTPGTVDYKDRQIAEAYLFDMHSAAAWSPEDPVRKRWEALNHKFCDASCLAREMKQHKATIDDILRQRANEDTQEFRDHQEAMKHRTEESKAFWKSSNKDQYDRWTTSEQKLQTAYMRVIAAIGAVEGVAT
jgi:hypothetical protein